MDLIVATSSFMTAPGISTWGTVAGETAHAALGLAKGLKALGHRVTLLAPLDPAIQASGIGLARRLSPLPVDVGAVAHERVVFDAKLPSGVELVLLGGESPAEATDPVEVARRWAWFGHAVAAFARARLGQVRAAGESELDAVIAVGEGAAFVPFAIREGAKAHGREGAPSPRLLAGLERLYVPIDLRADLRVPREALASIGVAPELFSPEGIEFYGQASLAKAGLVAADRVVALGEVSRLALARDGAAHKLDGVLRARGPEVLSVGSGVDQAQYNPATDPNLLARFDAEDLTGKLRARSTLVSELELEKAGGVPLLVVPGPVAEAFAGALAGALGHALRGELLVAVGDAGTEARALDAALERLQRIHPGRIAFKRGLTETQLHRLVAAGDLALLLDEGATGTPARAALRYGTVPVVPKTPAMQEAVVDLEASLATGTGVVFAGTGEAELFGAVQRAVSAFGQPGWAKLQRRAMRVEGGWERAARRLASILQQLEA
jgi:starch synthase